VHARVNTLQMDPAKIDDAVAALEGGGLDQVKSIDGFKGMTVLGDRQSGKSLAITFWESEDALHASEESVKETRKQATEAGGADDPVIEVYEVVLDSMV
jgi:heme-degrading monooxygenase HmoA